MFGFFLFMIALIIFTAQVIVWIISCFYNIQEDYVNAYRLAPLRKDHENYKRYERQQYLDSLRSYK